MKMQSTVEEMKSLVEIRKDRMRKNLTLEHRKRAPVENYLWRKIGELCGPSRGRWRRGWRDSHTKGKSISTHMVLLMFTTAREKEKAPETPIL